MYKRVIQKKDRSYRIDSRSIGDSCIVTWGRLNQMCQLIQTNARVSKIQDELKWIRLKLYASENKMCKIPREKNAFILLFRRHDYRRCLTDGASKTRSQATKQNPGRVTLCNISSRSPQATILATHQIITPAVTSPGVNLERLFQINTRSQCLL